MVKRAALDGATMGSGCTGSPDSPMAEYFRLGQPAANRFQFCVRACAGRKLVTPEKSGDCGIARESTPLQPGTVSARTLAADTTNFADLNRTQILALIRAEDWKTIGEHFGFEPAYARLHGRRYFNWASPNAAFWAAYEPHRWPRPEQPAPVFQGRTLATPEYPCNSTNFIETRSSLAFKAKSKNRGCRGPKRRQKLYAEQNGVCHYCQQHIPYLLWTIDHRLPKSKGGTDRVENLIGACKSCNAAKGNQTELEYLARIRPGTLQSPTTPDLTG